MPERSEERQRDVAVNRRAYHDYFIDEKYECGIVLMGSEVKSLRGGRCNLRDGAMRIDGNDAWLENDHISPYAQANLRKHDPMRPRKLQRHHQQTATQPGERRPS